MSDQRKHTPNGVIDILPAEKRRKQIIEAVVMDTFTSMGYEEVETPMFEYYDVFADNHGQVSQESMFKFFDEKGRILTLRPDITTSIARIAATKADLESLPVRFCYTGNVFRAEETQGARQREYTQSGIELLGSCEPQADAEVIAAAIEAVQALGITEFSMEIGQVAFYNGLVEQLGLSEEQSQRLSDRIDCKDTNGISEICEGLGIDSELSALMTRLPYLFGGKEVLDEADIPGLNETSRAALENISSIYSLLCDYGFEKYISIDLGMLRRIGYYTGVIFRGYTTGVAFPVCAGGRYDNLVSRFGKELPAVGVAFGINRLMSAADTGDGEISGKIMLFTEPGAERDSYDLAHELRMEGNVVVGYIGSGNIYECEKAAKQQGCDVVMRVLPDGTLMIRENGGEVIETTVDDFCDFYSDADHDHHCDCGHDHGHHCDCGDDGCNCGH